MRLKMSRAAAEERLINALNQGYRLQRNLWADYKAKDSGRTFSQEVDLPRYKQEVDDWLKQVMAEVTEVFPTDLELNYLLRAESYSKASYLNIDQEFAVLYYVTLPRYIDRLQKVRAEELPRYTDLPIKDRLFVEDIDSFLKVRDVNRSLVLAYLDNGYLDISEDEVQMGLESILDVSFHRKDWSGENNDLYTANVVINGQRRPTAFLLKGNGVKQREMQIRHCGKNGDQMVRLFQNPADLFVIQFVGSISEAVIHAAESELAKLKSHSKQCNFLIMDGQDTARLLLAYGKLNAPKQLGT